MAKKKQKEDKSVAAAEAEAGVATKKDNAKLQHTDELRDQAEAPSPAGVAPVEAPEGHSVTTRDDSLDMGVPMLPGSPDEPVGPEDALGPGPKRGDYTERLGGSGYNPHEGAEPQKPRVEQIGDEEGKKGGVETG